MRRQQLPRALEERMESEVESLDQVPDRGEMAPGEPA